MRKLHNVVLHLTRAHHFFLQIKCEGVVVSGQPEVKVIEGLVNLQADAVIIGTHDRSALSRYGFGIHILNVTILVHSDIF